MYEWPGHIGRIVGALLLLALGLTAPAWAQRTGELPPVFDGVGIDEQLGTTIPLGLVFQDEAGASVPLEAFFDGTRPVVLNFVYHECPMLCSLLLDGLTRTLQAMDWTPGQEFDILTVSFSGTETPLLAARQKDRYLTMLGKPEAAPGWHFLTGSAANIEALAASVGFQFKWVEDAEEYAHPAALLFLSGEGQVTRYLHGMDFPPRDVRTALVEASQGQVGTAVDKLILYCFRYDATANSYVPHAINLMKVGGLVFVLVLGGVLFVFWRKESRRHLAVGA